MTEEEAGGAVRAYGEALEAEYNAAMARKLGLRDYNRCLVPRPHFSPPAPAHLRAAAAAAPPACSPPQLRCTAPAPAPP